jgi:hypothetical protein
MLYQLSYTRPNMFCQSSAPVRPSRLNGKAGCRTRTDDLLITNQLLYQLS